MMNEPRNVGIAQLVLCRAPEQLTCVGLGSCVAVILYDPVTKIGGVVHVLLPKAPPNNKNEEKYADSGIRKLYSKILERGAIRDKLVAKLVGGAQMFTSLNIAIANIGKENIREARNTLRVLGVKIVAEDLEGNRGRSAHFDSSTGRVVVHTAFGASRAM
jgi:chemotaxis protein CheD